MKITKAIIPVAGFGTRFLPITKTINKSMLPVLNRPVVDYVVDDCIRGGITDIYFVVLPGETQLRNYYTRNETLEKYLLARNAKDKLKLIQDIHQKAKFHFIEQPQDGRYGTAIPPLLVQEYIEKNEHFLVLMGDDFIWRKDGGSEIGDMIDACQKANTNSMMAAGSVAKDHVSRYGVLAYSQNNEHMVFREIIEKPSIQSAPSNLINISKYLFDYDIFSYLRRVKPTNEAGEYYIVDAINEYVANKHSIGIHKIKGEYLDAGTVEGLLHANDVVALDTNVSRRDISK